MKSGYNMIKATIKYVASLSFVMLLVMSLGTSVSAQNILYSDNVIVDGDFAVGTLTPNWSSIIDSGPGAVAVANNEAAITGLTGDGNSWDVQLVQELSDAQIAALARGGDWELTFDARTTADSTKTLHVFLGENGGDWARYWSDNYSFTTDTTFTLTTNITQTWANMKLAFEVNHDAQDIFIDNIVLRRVDDNILYDGELVIGADSLSAAWDQVVSGASATFTVDSGQVKIDDMANLENSYDIQWYQVLDSVQLDSIYAGPYLMEFQARTNVDAKTIQVFFGNNGSDIGGGADWTNFAPQVTLDDTMKTYSLTIDATRNFPSMKIGFEVSADDSPVWFDNVIVRRIREVAPDAPVVSLTTTDGVVTISPTAQSSVAEYEVFFADSAFTSTDGASSVGTFLASEGTFTHSTAAPHPTLAEDFTAYYGIVAKTESGTASEITVNSIETGMTVAENYMVQLSAAGADAIFDAIESGTIPAASALAEFFPEGYKPFEISEASGRKIIENGSGGDDDADVSGKMWIGFDPGTAYIFFYAEITDDVLVKTPRGTTGGGGWEYDSWEGGIGAYSPESFINGTNHQDYLGGDEPDYQIRAGMRVDTADYMHANDQGVSFDVDNVNNSATIGDDTQTGMYRLLSILNTNALATYNPGAASFDLPSGTEVTTVPFQWVINDADAGTRDTQVGWSRKGGDDTWWNTPARWETVAMVGADAIPTSSEDEGQDRVKEFSLDQNYPNPFNPTTNISFKLGTSSNVTLEVYNLLGQKVATILQNQKLSAGSHSHKFDASSLASGLYVYRISTESFTQSRKMMLIK